MKQKIKNLLATVGRRVDLRDWLTFGGLALVCCGTAQIYPPAAWIVGGGVLMYLGMS